MEFQKMVNFLDTNSYDKDLPRFVTKKWIEVYDQSGENYNFNKEIRIKTSMLSDCNWTKPRTTWFVNEHSTIWPKSFNVQLRGVKEIILNSLAKWLSVPLQTKWFWVRVQLQSPKLQISRLLRARSSLTFRQL